MKRKIIDDIANKVYKDDHVSFVEVERIFESYGFNYEGDIIIGSGEYKNVIIWAGWNSQAVEILYEVINSKKIAMEPCYIIDYFIDGGGLNLQIAEKARDYVEPHWAPALLRPASRIVTTKNKL